jgi:hypothetical protein
MAPSSIYSLIEKAKQQQLSPNILQKGGNTSEGSKFSFASNLTNLNKHMEPRPKRALIRVEPTLYPEILHTPELFTP